jgi:hypothetical protein
METVAGWRRILFLLLWLVPLFLPAEAPVGRLTPVLLLSFIGVVICDGLGRGRDAGAGRRVEGPLDQLKTSERRARLTF